MSLDFDLVIVDDESPYPIDQELAELSQGEKDRILVIKQANAGPGGGEGRGQPSRPGADDEHERPIGDLVAQGQADVLADMLGIANALSGMPAPCTAFWMRRRIT